MMKTRQEFVKELGFVFVDTVVDRRGSVVLKVSREDEYFALKFSDISVRDTYDRNALLLQEVSILKKVNHLIHNQMILSGNDNEYGEWLLLRWVEGETVSSIAKDIRSSDVDKACKDFLVLFISIAEAYVKIHQKGFLHGDVQPAHMVLERESDQVTLFDWGLGREANSNRLDYRGGFVHYTAPEIAAGMLQDKKDMQYAMASEIYSLGATFFFLYTGKTAVNYGQEEMMQISLQQKLQAVAECHLRKFEEARNDCEKQIQVIIEKCLSPDLNKRFCSTEKLLQSLKKLSVQT